MVVLQALERIERTDRTEKMKIVFTAGLIGSGAPGRKWKSSGKSRPGFLGVEGDLGAERVE